MLSYLIATLYIPGVNTDKLRVKVRSIVENADLEELTANDVRKTLEVWLDVDLSDRKDAIRSLIMEVCRKRVGRQSLTRF